MLALKIPNARLWVILFLFPSFLFAEADPLKSIAQELAGGLSGKKNLKVAVLAVPYFDNRSSVGPTAVSEKLETLLVLDKRISVLDRHHVVQLLEEQHLSETGILDVRSTQRMGKLLGADIIITGTLIDLDDERTELNVRCLSPESGRIVTASRGILSRTWGGKPKLREVKPRVSALDWTK